MKMKRTVLPALGFVLFTASQAAAVVTTAPPEYSRADLDRIVSPIALYPDPLLAQVLSAATYSDQIPDAARWADEHHYLSGNALAAAIQEDQVPWDASVQALLPFPSVLDRMASDMRWTEELGNAYLAQQPQVMDAVQDMRARAADYGYLRSNAQIVVRRGPYIEIVPANPDYIVVPYYDPFIVYARPRPGFVIGSAIRFGFGVTLGAVYAPWGWHATRFGWGAHEVFINNAPWHRTWGNRLTYVHPYAVPRYDRAVAHRVEQHERIPRSTIERERQRTGQTWKEEHHSSRDHHGH
jgi:hypothetical protein